LSPKSFQAPNGAAKSAASNHHGKRSSAAAQRVQAALSSLRADQPICILSGKDVLTDGWLAAVASSHTHRGVELLLQWGQGPLFLALSAEQWAETGIEPNWSPMASIASCAGPPVDALDTVAAVVSRILEGGAARGDVPGWIQGISPQPGGMLRYASVVEAAYALSRRSAARGVFLRRAGDECARACGFQMLDLSAILEDQRALNGRPPIQMPGAARIPTRRGEFRMEIFSEPWAGLDYSALIKGDVRHGGPVLVRLHSACFTGDILGSLRCDCGAQVDAALTRIAKEGRGILLYLPQEGRGIGLYQKLQAYAAQDTGMDTVEANERQGFSSDLREYGKAACILRSLGVREVRLMTNNPHKIAGLEENGIRVLERVPLIIEPNPENQAYLETKRTRMGHLLGCVERSE